MTLTDFLATLLDNPYLGAGFGFFILILIYFLCCKVKYIFLIWFRYLFLIELEISSSSKDYYLLLHWLAKTVKHLKYSAQLMENDVIPKIGTHYFVYRNSIVRLQRTREFGASVLLEKLVLTRIGRRSDTYFHMMQEARKLKYEEEKIVLYAAVGSQWRQFGHPRKRPISSIILDEGVAERILYDVKEFIGIPYWYRERGIPYRRCYLLYGPTGCGKTSFITALAGELQCNICVVNLESGLSEDNLNQLVNNAPQQSIILLEDLDAFVSRVANDGLSRITFSGVCNILDGVASAEARILFITTNHLERLDPALIRPGRVDVKEYIGHASDFQLEQMYQRFYPEAGLAAAQEFIHEARKVNKPISMAMVQGFFMFYKNDAQGTTKNVQQMWDL